MDEKQIHIPLPGTRIVIRTRMGLFLLILFLISVSFLVLFWYPIAAIVVFTFVGPEPYETTEISQYGVYETISEESQEKYLKNFLPETLEPEFCNPQFIYHTQNHDKSGEFEVYLEFSIQDHTYFSEYVKQETVGMNGKPFPFDESYQEFVKTDPETGMEQDYLKLGNEINYKDGKSKLHTISIENACIRKILVNYNEQRIIYVVMVVDCELKPDTHHMDALFSRFGIDPVEYEMLHPMPEFTY